MTTYEHHIGIISVEGWGNPFLVVTDKMKINGRGHSYNYFKMGVEFQTEAEGKAEAQKLNEEYRLPRAFDTEDSQLFLLELQTRFPNAEIKKL